MEITGYPNCCTAKCIYSFGESRTSGTGSFSVSEAMMKQEFQRLVLAYGYQLLTAITNSEQPTVCKILKELGFEHSTWMGKRTHPETKLRLWWRRPTVRDMSALTTPNTAHTAVLVGHL